MYRVDEAICTGCGDCVAACPAGAILMVNERARIDEAACVECGGCADACPHGAILMVGAVQPAYPAIRAGASPTALAPVVSSGATTLAQRPTFEVLPARPRGSRLWPAVGGALVWAARELLPEVIAAWRASRAGGAQQTRRESTTFGLAAVAHRRTGHRHRWGRA